MENPQLKLNNKKLTKINKEINKESNVLTKKKTKNQGLICQMAKIASKIKWMTLILT